MVFLRWSLMGLLVLSSTAVFAEEENCEEECQQEESCRKRCRRPKYNPEEEALYRERSEVLYPSQREGMFQQMTHQ
jgi:hypothetical protein